MCGIFAYTYHNYEIRHQFLTKVLCDGLRKLEYRGYDSAGLCIDKTSEYEAPIILKVVGCVSTLEHCIENFHRVSTIESVLLSGTAIAHTRWATHGSATEENAHPISSDPQNDFVIVHNGVINNYHTLKKLLESSDNYCTTDTDTEVIALLLRHIHNENPLFPLHVLVQQVTSMIEGAFGIVVKSNRWFPGELAAANRGSCIAFGVKYGQSPSSSLNSSCIPFAVCLSSDAVAIAEHSNQISYLEDDDILHVTRDNFQVYAASSSDQLTCIARPLHLFDLRPDSFFKGRFAHFMLKEIFEQGTAIHNTIRGRLHTSGHGVTLGGISPYVSAIKDTSRILLIACGSSFHACAAVSTTMEDLVLKPVRAYNACEFIDAPPMLSESDALFFVSQSGETADVLNALSYSESNTPIRVGCTNVVGSTLSRKTICGTHVNAGLEVGVASTKSYTSQIVALLLISLFIADGKNQIKSSAIIDGILKLPDICESFLHVVDPKVHALAKRLVDEQSLIILGRGQHFATAREGALKIKEIAYLHAEAFHAGDIKHGPLALITEKMTVICIIGSEEGSRKMINTVELIHSRGGKLILIHSEGLSLPKATQIECIAVPLVPAPLECVVHIIPFQLLAYYIALYRGNAIDRPRNLAKSVTVE